MTQQSVAADFGSRTAADSADPAARPRIALVGVHGFGERHLANLARLEEAGALELVAVADPNPPAPGRLADTVAVFRDLDQLLGSGPAPDVIILATPIQTHAPLALKALAAGVDVYVEKPPVASMAQFHDVLAAAEAAGRLVQVGFQSLGSQALPAIRELVESGGIGDVLGLSAKGKWVRTTGYFKRSRWAGKRSIDGIEVVDGVATNALAHAVATALHIAGARTLADVASVETDLYRAHDTQSDDTSVIRVRTASGQTLLCALTLCAPEQHAPSVTVHGTKGEITFYYTADEVVVTTADGERREQFGRTDLLENLLAARSSGTPLLSSLADTGAFTTVLEAIRTAPDPAAIDAVHVTWEGSADDAHPVVHGIDAIIERACKAQATFAELGIPWARHLPPVRTLTLGGRAVADYQDGSRLRAVSSPRPYLHPVNTLAGTVVTDHLPGDHVWHLGAGVAIQDVDGVNFWGGRTYTRDAGAYVWRNDHGRIVTLAVEGGTREDSRTEILSWLSPDGAPLLSEQRTWSWAAVDDSTWRLTLDFELVPSGPDPVTLGSPGSNGRPQGGYGGFFWRLPSVDGATVWTLSEEGEDAVHGAVPSASAPWLAWSGTFRKGEPDGGPATLVFLPRREPEQPGDPWFVRLAGYPGVGLSLAWEQAATASHARPLRRTVSVLVADGLLTTSDIQQLITTLGESK